MTVAEAQGLLDRGGRDIGLGVWKTPSPMAGISTPLLRVTDGTADICVAPWLRCCMVVLLPTKRTIAPEDSDDLLCLAPIIGAMERGA
jgi:hypothetical protein